MHIDQITNLIRFKSFSLKFVNNKIKLTYLSFINIKPEMLTDN